MSQASIDGLFQATQKSEKNVKIPKISKISKFPKKKNFLGPLYTEEKSDLLIFPIRREGRQPLR